MDNMEERVRYMCPKCYLVNEAAAWNDATEKFYGGSAFNSRGRIDAPEHKREAVFVCPACNSTDIYDNEIFITAY